MFPADWGVGEFLGTQTVQGSLTQSREPRLANKLTPCSVKMQTYAFSEDVFWSDGKVWTRWSWQLYNMVSTLKAAEFFTLK
jgi:hypothetical protein